MANPDTHAHAKDTPAHCPVGIEAPTPRNARSICGRHTWAGTSTRCINRRADGGLELPLKLVQARLGHASTQMTADHYGDLFPRGDDAAEMAEAEKAFLV
jgi:integrase